MATPIPTSNAIATGFNMAMAFDQNKRAQAREERDQQLFDLQKSMAEFKLDKLLDDEFRADSTRRLNATEYGYRSMLEKLEKGENVSKDEIMSLRQLYNDTVNSILGGYLNQGNAKGQRKEFSGWVPSPQDRASVMAKLRVYQPDGSVEYKPMTTRRSADGDDPVMEFPIDTPEQVIPMLQDTIAEIERLKIEHGDLSPLKSLLSRKVEGSKRDWEREKMGIQHGYKVKEEMLKAGIKEREKLAERSGQDGRKLSPYNPQSAQDDIRGAIFTKYGGRFDSLGNMLMPDGVDAEKPMFLSGMGEELERSNPGFLSPGRIADLADRAGRLYVTEEQARDQAEAEAVEREFGRDEGAMEQWVSKRIPEIIEEARKATEARFVQLIREEEKKRGMAVREPAPAPESNRSTMAQDLQTVGGAMGTSGATPPRQAPPAAIEFLRANPHLKEQFRAKYGYLPEGF